MTIKIRESIGLRKPGGLNYTKHGGANSALGLLGCFSSTTLTISLPLQLESAPSLQLYLHRYNYYKDEIDQSTLFPSSFYHLDDEFRDGREHGDSSCGSRTPEVQGLLLQRVPG